MSDRGKSVTLYNDPRAAGAVVITILLFATFIAGLVALYIVKFHKPRVQDEKWYRAALTCFSISVVATFFVFIGSLAGAILFRVEPDPEFLFWRYSVIFFLEVFVALFITNRILVYKTISINIAAYVIPICAFFVFCAFNSLQIMIRYGIINVGEYTMILLSYIQNQILMPFDVIITAVINLDFFFPFNWAWNVIKNSQGNQFELTILMVPAFFIAMAVLSGIGAIFAALTNVSKS